MPLLWAILVSDTNAANLTTTYLRPYRLKAGQTAKMRLQFKTVSSGAQTLTIDMNGADTTTWSGSSGNVHSGAMTSDVATCATEIGGGTLGLPGSLTITGASSHTITITGITALAATTTYCIDFTNSDAVTIATAGEYHSTITESNGATDLQTVGVRSIAEDSVVVTATVPASFNFVFNNTTTDAFGNLSLTAATSTTGKTITLTTNAASGWIVWAKSANGTTKGSLQSAANSNYKITSSSALGTTAHTLTNGTEDYGLAVTVNTDAAGGGTVTPDPNYDSTASTKIGVLDSQNFRPIASANGTANGDIINVLERATVATTTPTGTDYTDTITFIGAGNF